MAASDLTASDFEEYDFITNSFVDTNHPNFSGGPMEFGLSQLFTINSALGIGPAYYDNMTISLDTAPPITVAPPPSR